MDDDSDLAVVFSSDKECDKLAAITGEQKEEGIHNFRAVDNMRVRVLPIVGTMSEIYVSLVESLSLRLGQKELGEI